MNAPQTYVNLSGLLAHAGECRDANADERTGIRAVREALQASSRWPMQEIAINARSDGWTITLFSGSDDAAALDEFIEIDVPKQGEPRVTLHGRPAVNRPITRPREQPVRSRLVRGAVAAILLLSLTGTGALGLMKWLKASRDDDSGRTTIQPMLNLHQAKF